MQATGQFDNRLPRTDQQVSSDRRRHSSVSLQSGAVRTDRRDRRRGLHAHRIVSSRNFSSAGAALLALDQVECCHTIQHTHFTDLPHDAPPRWKPDRRRRFSAAHHTTTATDITAIPRVVRRRPDDSVCRGDAEAAAAHTDSAGGDQGGEQEEYIFSNRPGRR